MDRNYHKFATVFTANTEPLITTGNFLWHTEPFLCNKRGPRYLQNKMGFWNSSICKGFRLAKQIMGDHIKKEVSKIIFLGTFCFQIQTLVQDLKCFKLFKNILEN